MSAKEVLLAAAGTAEPLPTFVSSSSNRVGAGASTNTVVAPANIQNGDLLILMALANGSFTGTPPAGFNVLSTDRGTNTSVAVASKVASSESGNYTWTWSGSVNSTVAILVYRNATFVNTIGTPARAASATLTASSITPTYPGTLIGVFFTTAPSASAITPPSGMTLRASLFGFNPAVAVYDLENQSAAATGTKEIVYDQSGNGLSTLLQVTNERTVAPEFVASASQQNTSTGLTLTINKPTGTVENDLMVAVMATDTGTTWSGDTGWTEVADQGVSPSLRVAYKVAGASEGGTYTFTVAATNTLSGCILTYRYAAYETIGSFDTSGNPLGLPSISPSESQTMLIAAGVTIAASVTMGTPTSMTSRVSDSDTNAPSYKVCDQPVAKGPTGLRSMSSSGSSSSGILLSIKPTRGL